MATVPVTKVKSLLEDYWDISNVSMPNIIEVNSADHVIAMDLQNKGDHLTIRSGFPAEDLTPVGNKKYGNYTYRVLLEVWTRKSRDTMYTHMNEIRRILNARRHLMSDFQEIKYVSFEEIDQEQNLQLWAGQIDVELNNLAVLLETS